MKSDIQGCSIVKKELLLSQAKQWEYLIRATLVVRGALT